MDPEPAVPAGTASTTWKTLPERCWPWLAAGFLAVSLAFVFSKSMQRSLDHDEHQFVASAAIAARDGLVPYRDFPHFHMPYLVYAYGALFAATDQLLLAARGLSVLCAWLTLALVLFAARRALAPLGPTYGPLLALALGVTLLFNPLFVYTTGIAWNHDTAILLSVAAFLVHARASGATTLRTGALLASGALLGVSAGMRLTTLPLAAPFVLSLWIPRRPHALAASVRFLAGLGLGLLPAFALFALAPGRAWFGNIVYAGLNTAYRRAEGFETAMTWSGKGSYLLHEVLGEPANLALLALCVAALVLRPRRASSPGVPLAFVLLTLPFVLLGSVAPTPSWYQYYYALVPFALIGLASCLGALADAPTRRAGLGAGVALAAALAVAGNLSSYRTLSNLAHPDKWTPSRIHAVGQALDAAAPPGPVLTVAPVFALEGGREIYPALASGPFALRTSTLMSPELRREQGVVSPAELDELVGQGPAAVLTGHDKHTDPLLDGWARQRGMARLELADGEHLYLPAARDG